MPDISFWRGVEYSRHNSEIVLSAVKRIYFERIMFEFSYGHASFTLSNYFNAHQLTLYRDDGSLRELYSVGCIEDDRDSYKFNPNFGTYDLDIIESKYPGFNHDWNEFGRSQFHRIGDSGLDRSKLNVFKNTNYTLNVT